MFGSLVSHIRFAHISVALVALAFAGLVAAWWLNSVQSVPQPAIATERATTTLGVTRSGAHTSVRISASLEPARTSHLSFETGGRVGSVAVDEGARVRAGEQLARVSVDELQAQLAQAKAKLRAAQAQRQKVATGTRSEQIAVYRAQLEEVRTSIDSQTAQLSQMTENVYTVADEAVHGVADRFFDNPGGVPDLRLPPRGVDDDTLESLRDTLNSRFAKWQQHRTESTAERANRVRALLTETGELLALLASIANRNDVRVAPDKLEALSGARERVANAQTSLAKSQTALSGAQTKHAVAKRQLALAKAGSRSEDISATAANEDEVRAKIHELRERIAGATITAPYSGVITDVSIERGELAKSGSPVLTIADHSSWLVRGEAASRLAPALNEGQSVTITPAGYARSFTGELATVMPALDGQSGALVLEARTAALPDTVKEGQAVSMSVPLTLQGSSHYFVPRAFVGFSYDGPFVETVDGQRHVVDVQSSTDDTYTIGVSDLRASTTIIVP